MIAKYKLFELERNAGVPMELVIEKMQKNITVDLEKSETDKVAAFSLKYRDRSPEAARNVTAELASKFVNEQVIASTENAETTKNFIDNSRSQAKATLDSLEKQRLEIMMNNVDTLPEAVQGLIAQREGLQQREETISKEKESLMMQKGRLTDSIRALNSQARLIEDFGEKETQEAVGRA
jgi:phosphate starvation-inducible protein PhoH